MVILGNLKDNDGCTASCTVQPGWSCTENSSLTSICQQVTENSPKFSNFFKVCGNGYVTINEQCDDGNHDNGDGCNALCQIENSWKCVEISHKSRCALCGNGHREETEECDDGNGNYGDGCSDTCSIESGYSCYENSTSLLSYCNICGDGINTSTEQCDDGGRVSGMVAIATGKK